MTNDTLSQINNLIDKLVVKVSDKEELEYWRSIASDLTEEEQGKLLDILERENKQLEELEKTEEK